ncbi:MAG: MarR family transcriptional regulator [Actinomycetota bacterium]
MSGRRERSPRAAGSPHHSARLDDAVAYRIHRTNRLLLTHLGRLLETRQHGLTPEKWFVLARLAESGPMHQVELTEPALEDAPNVSRLVDSLVGAGFVERRPSVTDGRARVVELTAEGRTLAADLLARAMAERHRVFDGFSDAELATLSELLDRVDANARALLADRLDDA